jgi:hypothetical protein
LRRLGDGTVHAGFQALLTIAGQGIGCDKPQFLALGPKPAYFLGSLEAIPLRDLYTHENEIVRLPFQIRENLLSIYRGICPVARLFEHFHQGPLVGWIIFGHQDHLSVFLR